LTSHPEHVAEDIDLGVALRFPVDRELVHSEPVPLGFDKQFRVPEPVLVRYLWAELIECCPRNRFETTLMIL
jgi:hypothetical protein